MLWVSLFPIYQTLFKWNLSLYEKGQLGTRCIQEYKLQLGFSKVPKRINPNEVQWELGA